MFLHQVFSVCGSHIACRRPVPPEYSREDALAYAEKLATECVVELWMGDALLASYGPELSIVDDN